MKADQMRANAALCRAFAEASRCPELRKVIMELGAEFEDAAAEVESKRPLVRPSDVPRIRR